MLFNPLSPTVTGGGGKIPPGQFLHAVQQPLGLFTNTLTTFPEYDWAIKLCKSFFPQVVPKFNTAAAKPEVVLAESSINQSKHISIAPYVATNQRRMWQLELG